jgi:SHAQKYF class myb-like DNA-binding protein
MENQENQNNYGIIKKFNVIQNENEGKNMFISKKLFEPKKLKIKDSQIKFITKKNFYFKIEDTNECKKKISDSIIANEGRWSKEEHEKFLEGIVLYGINWKKVKTLIGSRTSIQVRSHAQKFFYKMKTCKDETLGIDFTLNSIGNIRDMINQIKNNNANYNIISIFKYLTYKCDNLEKSRKKIAAKNSNNFDEKKNEPNIQPNIISLKENNININDKNFFFNQNYTINEQKIMKDTQNIDNKNVNISLKMNNQNNNIINILHSLLTINYYSNAYNFLLSNNINSPSYDITNSVNKLLINFLITNNSLNNSNLINENILLSLALQNNILNNINNINFIHNINNNIDLNNVNYKNNINDISNYNFINNIENGNKNKNSNVKDNQDFGIHIDEKDNIKDNIDNNNNNDNIDNINNRDNKDCNIELNKEDFLYINKEKNNSPNEKNCINNSNIPSQSI